MEAAAASAMDFHALSRRELQALCKRNGVRANMTNAAMAEALQGLTSVDGIDEIGSTLCLPTPGRSTMKSAVKAAALAGEEQQQGSPLPRGRRVSVMSPAAIRLDVEDGDDEVKRDVVKEIVKTPGVALRSNSRRARATPAPLLTPATLRRSQRTAARKAAAPVEAENRAEEVPTAKKTTRRSSARSKMMMDLDQEEEVPAAAPEVQQEEPKDVNCDDLEEEEEVTKLLEGNNKEEEPEEGEEADSSDATNGSAVLSDKSCEEVAVVVDLDQEEEQKAVASDVKCDDLEEEEEVMKLLDGNNKEEEPEEGEEAVGGAVVSDKSCEDVAVVVEQEATQLQEGTMEEQEPVGVEKSVPLEDSPILGVLSKVEATESVIEKAQHATVGDDEDDEWSPVNEKTEINPVNEATDEITPVNEMAKINPVSEDMTLEVPVNLLMKRPQMVVPTESGPLRMYAQMLRERAIAGDASEDFSDEETSEAGSDEEVSEDFSDEEASEDGSDEEASEAGSDDEAGEAGSDDEASEAEDDDFSGDLPPEFDNVVVLSDAETVSDTTLPVLDENQTAFASATKSAVKSLDDSAISEEVSSEVSEEADNTVDTIVKSLDEFTVKEGTQEAEELQKQLKFEDLHSKSLRQLKAMYKDTFKAKEGKQQVAADGGKRLPLAEVDDNAGVDC